MCSGKDDITRWAICQFAAICRVACVPSQSGGHLKSIGLCFFCARSQLGKIERKMSPQFRFALFRVAPVVKMGNDFNGGGGTCCAPFSLGQNVDNNNNNSGG